MPMPDNAPLSLAFNLPYDEAIHSAADRGVLLPSDYYTLPDECRQYAQTVSGLARLDQIQSVMDRVNAHLAQGGSFATFKQQVQTLDLGLSRGKLDLVFRNAVQGAYNAGNWRHFEQHQDARPYLMYDAVNDSRTRPAHRAMNGIIRPVGDPFWATHSPPCGHRCRCKLISLSAEEMARRGGVTKDIPEGAQADEGWGYKPTQRMEAAQRLLDTRRNRCDFEPLSSGNKPPIWCAGEAKKFLDGLGHNGGMENKKVTALDEIIKFIDGNGLESIVVAAVPVDICTALGADSRSVLLSRYTVDKQVKHPEVTPEKYLELQLLLDAGERIYDKKNHVIVVYSMSALWMAVLKVTNDKQLVFLQSFRRTDQKNLQAIRKSAEGGD